MEKDTFLKEYRISVERFDATKLDWGELQKISADHSAREKDLLIAGNSISDKLRQIPEVHSIKMRVKDPAHLIEKIIRKKEENPGRVINLRNYHTEITDLVGVRALHLYKEGCCAKRHSECLGGIRVSGCLHKGRRSHPQFHGKWVWD